MDSSKFETAARKGLEIFRGKETIVKIAYVLVALGIVTVGGLYLAPLVYTAFENLIYTAFLGVALFAIGYVIFSPTFQTAFVYFLDNIILRLRNLVITSDPFSTAQNAINKLSRRKEEMRGYVENLGGARKKLSAEIEGFTAERSTALNRAKLAGKQGITLQQTRYANTADRLLESIKRLQPMLQRSDSLYAFLTRMYQLLDAKVAEESDALNIALREHSILETSANAVRQAQKAMSGPDQEMFNDSMQAISDRTFALVGEVEFFMDMTKPLLDTADFESQAKSMEAMDHFNKWLGQDSELIPREEKQQLLLQSGNPTQFLTPVQAVPGDKYQLIDRKK